MPLTGEYRRDGNGLTLRLAPKAGVLQTQKIRWILPATPEPSLVRLSAFTRSSWTTTKLFVEIEKPKPVQPRRNHDLERRAGSQIQSAKTAEAISKP